jgi:hypothetical protein
MDIVAIVKNLTPFEQISLALMALLIVVSCPDPTNNTHSLLDQPEFVNFDQFSDRTSDVNTMMVATLTNPTYDNLRSAKSKLLISHWNWSERESGQNKELFQAYLLACVQVIEDKQAGNEPDLTKMNSLKNKLI